MADGATVALRGDACGVQGGRGSREQGRAHAGTDEALLQRVNGNLHYFSTKGLRTLVVGVREIDGGEFENWEERFRQANNNLTMGEELIDRVRRRPLPPLRASPSSRRAAAAAYLDARVLRCVIAAASADEGD